MIVDVNLAIEDSLAVDAHQTSDAASRSLHAQSSFDLVMRARAGDAAALDFLCARYLPRLRRWAHGRLPTRSGAHSTPTTWSRTRSRRSCSSCRRSSRATKGHFQAYVRQTLLNRIRDEARRGKRRGTPEALDSAMPSPDSSPLENAIGTETLTRYEAAMARLRPANREAIIARIELRLSYTEVAACLGKPSVAAAHVAVSRALVRLANEMSHDRSR